ncbi:MAG: phosphoesterase [Dyadobacter sp. 50-39]|uniref:phosphatase PAP2 family protein n=1 Tax=Dyadobacter sp. 50-39 TaxID=1895756 RepID=UPI00095BF106|nr:phosphatase PAP2 family protein [Dyadobacter sp. 50-39]OJV15260.1 MAG: phosphoesterase [Dyadobacter sp. 50-39]
MLDNFLSINSERKNLINTKVINNYSKVKPSSLFLPAFSLLSITIFLYLKGALSATGYIRIQKECFYAVNSKLSQLPNLIYNLTQVGDTLFFLSFLTIFILYAPKIWGPLIIATILSPMLCIVPKNLFQIPRPAASFDNSSFVIIGGALSGHNSLPSGHAITIFTILTVLLFAFLPKNRHHKVLCIAFIFSTGLALAFTRVGVGAHYPLDVIIGCIIGYICGLSGILIDQKYKIWIWVDNTKYDPIFVVLLLASCVVLAIRAINENLTILYLPITISIISISKIAYKYAKK